MIDVNNLIGNAMKSRDSIALNAYKNLKAEIQIFKTAKNAKPYDEAAEINLISKMCKKLSDSISEFKQAGRNDLVEEYTKELEVLKTLIPPEATKEDIEILINDWLETNDIKLIPKQSMGIVIQYVKLRLPNADGKLISELVRLHLG